MSKDGIPIMAKIRTMIEEIQSPTLFKSLLYSDIPIIIDFHATWCGPCRGLEKVLKEVKSELGNSVRIVKIDVDQNLPLVEKVEIMGVPTVMIYHQGKEYFNAPGVQTKVWFLKKMAEITAASDSNPPTE